MKCKRLVSIGLTVAMTVAVLTACGSQNNKTASSESATSTVASVSEETEESPKEIVFPLEETMKFSALALVPQEKYPLAENTAWNALLERGNIEVELTEIPSAEAKEKGNLIMAGGNYPDFLFKMSSLDLDKYGQDGLLIPLEDLIRDYAPNLTALLDELDAWEDITAPDGHIYSLPTINQPQHYGTSWIAWINTKWLENIGMDMPETNEELYKVLKAFKEQDANGNGDPDDEVPFSFNARGYQTLLSYMGDALQYYWTYAAVKNGECVFYPRTQGYYDFLAEMRKWYEEGLIYENSFTQTVEQEKALGKSGDTVGMFLLNTPKSFVSTDYWADYKQLMPFNAENFALSSGVAKRAFAITDRCENPEILISWIDYLYSEEGGMLVRGGVEGDTLIWNEDDTFTLVRDKYENTAQWALTGSGNVPCLTPEIYYTKANVEEDPVAGIVNASYAEDGLFRIGTVLKNLKYTEEEEERRQVLAADIPGYVNNYSAEVITGKKSLEDTWEEFQQTMEKMGVVELENIYKAAYERAYAE